VLAATAAAAAVILLVAIGGFFAGRSGLFGSKTPQAPVPSAIATGNGAASGSGAPNASTASGGAASSPAAAAADLIYKCPTNADAAVWACLKSVRSSGGKLLLDYSTNFQLSAIQDASHYHFHVYLAKPGPNGTTVPTDAIMQHVPNAGSWFILYDGNVKVIDNTTERGGKKLGIDTANNSLLCVRVAVGIHDLAKDKKGGYRTGNCAKITS
jgi:hypothetical protein